MSPKVSLFKLESDLAELLDMREQALAEGLQTITVIDHAIAEYYQALPKKVDDIGSVWKWLEAMADEPKERQGRMVYCAIDREIKRLQERRDRLRERLVSIKTMVQFVMESMPWREGKPRKLEGVRHTISLKGNGGKQPVVVTDEALVPDECCIVKVEMRADRWKELAGDLELPDIRWQKVPSLSLIAEALVKPCPTCKGNMDWTGTVDDGIPCPACGGTGLQGIPGARLDPRGAHVECK